MPALYLIDPSKHPVGEMLARKLSIDVIPYATKSGSWSSISARPIEDIPRPRSCYAGTLALNLQVPPGCFAACGNYFPAGGGMDWHTDSHRPGWRIYVYRMLSGTARFLYRDHVITEEGVGGYVFETGPDCWHAIEATGPRVSCGLKIPEDLAQWIVRAAA